MCSPAVAAALPSAPLPFGLTSRGAIIVPVSIDGSAPVSLLLDTGSNGSLISDRLAASLDMRAVARTTLASAIGHKEVVVARIAHMTIGPIAATNVLATIVPAGDLNLPDATALGLAVQGVIGQDVLSALHYTIDYRERRIYWREPSAAAPAHAARFELERQDDRFVVGVPQGTSRLRLVPDTGTEALVLFDEAAWSPGATGSDQTVGVTGLAGTSTAHQTRVPRLRVGDAILTDVPAVIVRGRSAVDGLLPLHLFARVTFDGPNHQLFIERR
jgi:predicted aspartyl protease